MSLQRRAYAFALVMLLAAAVPGLAAAEQVRGQQATILSWETPGPTFGLDVPDGMQAEAGGLALSRGVLQTWTLKALETTSGGFVGALPRIRAVVPHPGGMTVTDSDNARVVVLNGATRTVRTVKVRPFSAQLLDNGHLLVCDRNGYRVIDVAPSGEVTNVYGTGVSTKAGDGLADPFCAERRDRKASENVLICDNIGGMRVIEVDRSRRIVWTGPSGLKKPKHAEWVTGSGGTEVIIGDEDADAVSIWSHTTPTQLQWKFDATNAAAVGLVGVFRPSGATVSDGVAYMTDAFAEGKGRILAVDRSTKSLVYSFGDDASRPAEERLRNPRYVAMDESGRLLVADENADDDGDGKPDGTGAGRVVAYGRRPSAEAVSGQVPEDATGSSKEFYRLTWQADPRIEVLWRRNAADAWHSAGRSGTYVFDRGVTGLSLYYKVVLSTSDARLSPVFRGLKFEWVAAGSPWPEDTTPPPDDNGNGGGGNGGNGKKSGRNDSEDRQDAKTRIRLGPGSGDGGGNGNGNGGNGGNGSGNGGGNGNGGGTGTGAGGTGTGTGTGGSGGTAGSGGASGGSGTGKGPATGWVFKAVNDDEKSAPSPQKQTPARADTSAGVSMMVGLYAVGWARRPRPFMLEM